jgi:glycine/sarcosine N-methyltransferase
VTADAYKGLAERYDWMRREDPHREAFFRRLFERYSVTTILDCACGTGRDLLMFKAMGLHVFGSDLSDSMLAQARSNVGKDNIPIERGDYRELPQKYDAAFDAVVCLTNSINEPLEDVETLKALRSMKAVLRRGGILVFDQGQTDASMKDPPRFVSVVNNSEFTRCFALEYSGDIQTVNILDFAHTEAVSEFKQWRIRIRVRLVDSWREILGEAGFVEVEFFGDWDSTPYDRTSSRRLIAVATERE